MIERIRIAALAVAVLGVGLAAQAVPITGGINFTGDLSTGSFALPLTTQFFFNGPECAGCIQETRLGPSGSYAGIPAGTDVTFQNFVFKPTLPGPVLSLWTFTFGPDTYSFDLTSVISTGYDGTNLSLLGTGVAKKTGLDDTFSSFSLTTQDIGAGTGTFSFSASTSTDSPVPEPATLLLLGSGLTGLGLLRKRRRA